MTSVIVRRIGRLLTAAGVFVMLGSASIADAPAAAAGGPGAAGVKKLLDDSGLKFKWDDTNKVGSISYSEVKDSASDTVLVYSNDDEKGYYVMFNLCIIDKGAAFVFPPAFLRKCMELNNNNPLVKLGWNKKMGRIYASFGADMDALPARIFKDYCSTMIRQGDRLAGELKAFLAAAEELATDGNGK